MPFSYKQQFRKELLLLFVHNGQSAENAKQKNTSKREIKIKREKNEEPA